MNKKGSVNIILVILVVVLLGVVGYLVLGNSDRSPVDQEENEIEGPVLSKEEALTLANETWGACTGPDSGCTSRTVEIEKRGNVWYATVISSGLADDSTGHSKRIVPVYYEDNAWKLGAVESETFKCWGGRGHQDFF